MLFKRGDSLAVIIPVEVCKELQLKAGDDLYCDIDNGKVTLERGIK